jgi:hypothetical protein
MDETTDHLLCSCVFTREVWTRLLLLLQIAIVPPQQDSSLLSWWLSSRDAMPQALRWSFDSLVLLAFWTLWKERNRHTFHRKFLSSTEELQAILDEANAGIGAGFRTLALLTTLVE